MKVNGLTPIYFDIETTGFSAWEDEFVCGASMTDDVVSVETDLGKVVSYTPMIDCFNGLIITYNGENYHGGFDFPWLRSKCIQQGIDWQLAGVKHLDLLPLVRKYINTSRYGAFKKSDFKASDLKKLAKENDVDYQNKGQCLKELKKLENTDWLDYERSSKEDNSLQAVYQMMFDPEREEEYIKGGKIPKLYKAMQENISKKAVVGEHEEIIKANKNLGQQIKEHNSRDVERLKKIAEKIIPVIPDWEIERNIKEL